jgi:hypothetical protein
LEAPELLSRVSRAKSEFDVAVPRVHDASVRQLLETWATKAVAWANDELGAADEDTAWKQAMKKLGEAERELG